VKENRQSDNINDYAFVKQSVVIFLSYKRYKVDSDAALENLQASLK